jgi:hypothetical protein
MKSLNINKLRQLTVKLGEIKGKNLTIEKLYFGKSINHKIKVLSTFWNITKNSKKLFYRGEVIQVFNDVDYFF